MCELLIDHFAEVNVALEITVVTTHYGSNAVFNTVVDDVAGNLADIVLCSIVAFHCQYIEPVRFLLTLLVGNTLIIGLLLIPILVD